MKDLTKEEKKWIAELQKVMQKAPESLWLFNTGTMHVLKLDEKGKQVFRRDHSVDQAYVVASINHKIASDGGDW